MKFWVHFQYKEQALLLIEHEHIHCPLDKSIHNEESLQFFLELDPTNIVHLVYTTFSHLNFPRFPSLLHHYVHIQTDLPFELFALHVKKPFLHLKQYDLFHSNDSGKTLSCSLPSTSFLFHALHIE